MTKARNLLDLWVDDTKMAFAGAGMVLRRPRYALLAVLGFLFFAYFFAMFQDGSSVWSLLWSKIELADKMRLLADNFWQVFRNFADGWGLILNFMALLQGLNVALLVFGLGTKMQAKATVAGLEAGGAGTAISILALGCPTCGTSLLVPLLSAVLGSGAAAAAEAVGWVLTVVAIVLLLHAARRLGYGAYIEITARRHKNAKG